MQPARALGMDASTTLCLNCGIPLDAKQFDESGVVGIPEQGRDAVLARFELSPQYCGVLQYFSQFTDQFAMNSSKIETPGLEWIILSNRQPLYPYIRLERILNPWGFGSFEIAIRLDESATIEFVVRRRAGNSIDITRVGGRIVGRYWYNTAYGAAGRNGR
jgi:hypothetical protein